MGPDRLALRVVFFGTYDAHRPRFRVLRQGLELAGLQVIECRAPVWGRMEDRGQIDNPLGYLRPVLAWLLAMPFLALAYLRLPPHDVVVVPYIGHVDILLARLLSRLRRVPVVFDPFISLYQTVVHDRQRVGSRGLVGRSCRLLDRLSFRAADHVLVDTAAHGRLFADDLGLKLESSDVVPVGAEPDLFRHEPLPEGRGVVHVLFYGWMIPLHGVDTIIRATAILKNSDSIRFTIVGRGQDYDKVRRLSQKLGTDSRVRWVDAVPYGRLPQYITEADICLGIFGISRKARAVVPNKVFQALAVGRPVITGDTAAAREWFLHGENCLLVPPGDYHALAGAIEKLANDVVLRQSLAEAGFDLFNREFSPRRIGERARLCLSEVVSRQRRKKGMS